MRWLPIIARAGATGTEAVTRLEPHHTATATTTAPAAPAAPSPSPSPPPRPAAAAPAAIASSGLTQPVNTVNTSNDVGQQRPGQRRRRIALWISARGVPDGNQRHRYVLLTRLSTISAIFTVLWLV